ncbi:DUF4153 domain-containing protein [Methylobacillus gramineus]|uniref:DUF4153 domain-containing protein n=1 Tax=Methylobacillus gramineus TaxID=755169 RepID=UPI001CFF5893|nr:DUF4153 domain-containing protein [Methylobacillus gramineus]MCB5185104.1 DUF4153 domain-containing protein [Methylobacillus gramineus]
MDKQERGWIIAWAALQGVSLWLLHEWLLKLSIPGQYFSLIWPLYAVIITLPLSLMVLSHYRQQTLLWSMATGFSVLMAGAAAYMGHQAWVADLPVNKTGELGFILNVIALSSWFVLLPFAEHKLSRGSWASDYPLLFSAAWRNWIKLMLAALFTGLFWTLLFLLAGLFKVLNVNTLMDWFTSRIFAYPATTIIFGIGLSLYAAKEEALVGIYRASLNILGWLLPLVSFILLLFLLALPFQGLALLWKTGYATSLMLSLLAWTVFLFNAAWQDASGEQRFPRWLLRFIGLSLLVMPVYIALCVYSLGLRVTQYGWTIDRVWAALVIVVMAIYALGYAWVVLRRQPIWMASASRVNIGAALITVALAILTCSPVLDPARIAVNSQVARLLQQKVDISSFDFEYLRLEAGRYGNQALLSLSREQSHPQAALLRKKATDASKVTYRTFKPGNGPEQSDESVRQQLKIYPHDAELPAAFLQEVREQLNRQALYLNCQKDKPCPVLKLDLNHDGMDELILLNGYSSLIFELSQGRWKSSGRLSGVDLHKLNTQETLQALDSQDFASKPARWGELWIGDMKYGVQGE